MRKGKKIRTPGSSSRRYRPYDYFASVFKDFMADEKERKEYEVLKKKLFEN